MSMMIRNDRRWPEFWRVLGLQGVELVCIGYNSAACDANGGTTQDSAPRTYHSKLVAGQCLHERRLGGRRGQGRR